MANHTRPGPLSLPLAGGARLVATAERGPDPSGRWYWRVRHHGEGARPTVTEQVLGASAWATEADVGRAMAVWVTSATPLKPAAWTVRHLLEQWLTTYVQRERLSPQTRALAEQTCTALSLQGGRLLDLRLDEVTRPVVDAFIARLRADKYDGEHTYSDRTVQIRVGHLMGGLKAAVEYDVIDSVPTVKRPRVQVTRERRWATPDQAVRLVQALRRRRIEGRLSAPSYTARPGLASPSGALG
jgi:hypothetical protein